MSILEKTHPLAERLERITHLKESNLILSADVSRGDLLLQLAERCASQISILKTHVDILEDFDPYIIQELRRLADRENFLLFEDRMFSEIGNTVELQYQGGIYQIADWAHLTSAHTFLGPAIIESLKKIGLPRGNALLLLAQASSQGHWLDPRYTAKTVELAKMHRDFVVGFICEEKLCDGFLHITPGINVAERGSDYIIVGREIITAEDPYTAAEEYRLRGWEARVGKA